jgi:predicted nuclease of predicted toxin-antitoxin system
MISGWRRVPSKKPSAAKPPDGTVFFLDRSLGVEPVRTQLIQAGLLVEIHDDHFARDEADSVWLKAGGERGWVILTKDQRLRYRPLEIAALRSSKARVFVLMAGNLRGIEIAEVFVSALLAICKVLHRHRGSFLAHVSKSGKVTMPETTRPARH